jgi:hypothetical protein
LFLFFSQKNEVIGSSWCFSSVLSQITMLRCYRDLWTLMSITFHVLQDLDVIPAEWRFNHYITKLVGSAD